MLLIEFNCFMWYNKRRRIKNESNQTYSYNKYNVNNFKLSSVYAKSISGYAWDDANKDGEYNEESEIKLPNIEAELLRVNEDESEEVIQTTKTDSSGNYRFDGLGDGRYKVRFKYGTYNQFIEHGTAKYNGQDYRTTGSGVSVS